MYVQETASLNFLHSDDDTPTLWSSRLNRPSRRAANIYALVSPTS